MLINVIIGLPEAISQTITTLDGTLSAVPAGRAGEYTPS